MAGHERLITKASVARSTSDDELVEGHTAVYNVASEEPDIWLFNPVSNFAACSAAGLSTEDSSSSVADSIQQDHTLIDTALWNEGASKLGVQHMPHDWTATSTSAACKGRAPAAAAAAEPTAQSAAKQDVGKHTPAMPEQHRCSDSQQLAAAAPYQHINLKQEMQQLSSQLQELRTANAAAAAAAGNLNLLLSTFLIKATSMVQAGPKLAQRHLQAQADLRQLLQRKVEHWTVPELTAVRGKYPCLCDRSSSNFIACNNGGKNHRSKAGIRRDLIAGLTRQVLEVSPQTEVVVPPDV
uniref:Uncharacterized protein n=1 Tax=Tetradesmus obliquus TaxID=3088 RepID=A0A383W5Q0_TETOB|eukprot:jgi/Sobl393_1/10144/SZX79480.1